MAASSASLLFSNLSLSKTLPFTVHASPPSRSFISLLASSSFAKPAGSLTASFRGSRLGVSNVAVVSDFDVSSDFGKMEVNEPDFPPDLKLFVGNLAYNIDSADLAGLFEQAGNVEMVEVIYDKMTGRSKGFGFVTMSTVEEVEAAARLFNGFEFAGRPLRVNSGPPPTKDEKSGFRGGRGSQGFESANRVYVTNLSWTVDNSSLKNLFSQQGKVEEAFVVYDRESGRSRGFGFVGFSSVEEANNAITSLDGSEFSGRSIRVSMAESKPKRF